MTVLDWPWNVRELEQAIRLGAFSTRVLIAHGCNISALELRRRP